MQCTSWETLGWMKHKLESRFPGEISVIDIKPQIRRHHHFCRKWRKTKESLDESEKGEQKKVGLKLNIQKTKMMASSPITSWPMDGGTMEIVRDFIIIIIIFGSRITADGDYSHEIKRHLLLERKVMPNRDSILKGRDITLPTK